MNLLIKSISLSRVVTKSSGKSLIFHEFVSSVSTTPYRPLNVLNIIARNMSQRSITSFFTKTPKKSLDLESSKEDNSTAKDEGSPSNKTIEKKSPVPKGNSEMKPTKRQRIESSESETKSPQKISPHPTPVKSDLKKKVKRQRIESSDSEVSRSPVRETTSENIFLKSENTKESPKTYASPKSKNLKVNEEKSPLVEKNVKDENKKKSPPKKKEIEVKKEKNVTKKEKKQSCSKSPPIKKEKVDVQKDDAKENGGEGKVAEEEYNPAKAKYHPIKDACWSRGEEVPYLALAKTLEAIEGTSARLKMIEILSNYFRSVMVLTPEDLLPSVYMCLNQLAPAYHSLELGIAETYLMKAIGQCTGRTLAQVKSAAQKSGDLGLVAEQARATQRTMFTPPPLKGRRVFAALKDIANMTGQSCINKKIGKIQSLYVACRHSEARYLIRSLAGKLRIGLAEQSVLQALALSTAMTPPGEDVLDASKGLSADEFKSKVEANALIIKTTYCECPNYELVIPTLLQHGVSALPQYCKLTPGIPLKPMLAHPTKGVHEVFNRFEGVQFTCEWKYDGERAQIHVPSASALTGSAIYSRNQENNTSKYPDLLRRLPSLLKETVTSCVLDCEAVAYDVDNKQILPFQVLSTRKRKDASEADIKVQVCVFLFDLLYLNGEPLVREPLAVRRQLMREHLNQVEGEWQFATSSDCSTMEEVQQFLEESVKGSCEGLMVKTLQGRDATYEIAKRSHNWLKLKKDYLEGVGDTVDAVVIGAYSGRGKRAGVYGGFLLACYEPDSEEYQSLCKIGTGFSDEDLQTLSQALQQYLIDAPRGYYRFDSSHTPDAWFSPACVWEVRCADLSLSPAHRAAAGLVDTEKGISLRFPRFVRVRDDKTPENATSAQQVADLYLSQDQVKNQTTKNNAQDDFY